MFTYMYKKLDAILLRLEAIDQYIRKGHKEVMTTIDDLAKQVESNASAEGSAVILIKGIADQLAAVANDPVKITAMVARLNQSATALAQAITANTPAAVSVPANPPANPPVPSTQQSLPTATGTPGPARTK